MGKGGYLGGSTLIGPRSNWFSKPLSVEDRAQQAAEDKARAWQERMQAERETGQRELEKLSERQAVALSSKAARSTPEGVEKRRLRKLERAETRKAAKGIGLSDSLKLDYPELAADIDAIFRKPE